MDSTRLSLALGLTLLAACGRSKDADDFSAMQMRGEHVMGVNQYTSAHVFEDLPDGGRIVLERADASDTAAVKQIRAHMHEIAEAFRAGDFAKPFEVHAQTVPGTEIMRAKRAAISYEPGDLPKGGEVRIKTSDAAALAAVHQFLQFQREQHHAMAH